MNRLGRGRLLGVGLALACAIPLDSAGAPAGDRAQNGRPGEQMVDVGGRRLHAFAHGSGSPTVVLVSGLDSPQASWDSVVPALAALATVVTYDRAGIGRSEIGNLPTHGEQSARDLHALLGALGVPRPYVVVGHSYGGFVARLFASMYPDEMAGLILEETQHEDVVQEMRAILKGKDLEAFDEAFSGMLLTPANAKAEADYRNVTREQLRKSRPLPRIPLLVLTCRDRARAMPPVFTGEAIEAMVRLDAVLMNRLTASVPGGRQIVVEGSGHYIHVDKPEVLLAPLKEMIGALRGKSQ